MGLPPSIGPRSGRDQPGGVNPQKGTHRREVFPVLLISRILRR
jgi:hypothetical protein